MSVASRFWARLMKYPPARTYDVRHDRDLPVVMRDGAVLLADRYHPRTDPDAPLLLMRSLYGRRGLFGGIIFGRLFAERGFQVVVQSMRGTFGSDGDFDPFVEREDGHDTVAWLRRQEWYPGSFSTIGTSYLGIAQWAIAAERHPDHRAMAIAVSATEPYEVFFESGVQSLASSFGWVDLLAHQERPLAMLRQQRAAPRVERIMENLPLEGLDVLATGREIPYWREWMRGSDALADYWTTRAYGDIPEQVEIPVAFVAGWSDMFLRRELHDYGKLVARGLRPRLTIGPWHHAEATVPAAIDALEWLRLELLGDPAAARELPAKVFFSGTDTWHAMESWPPPTEPLRLHLHADGTLSESEPTGGDPSRWTYDPANPTPSVGGPLGDIDKPRLDNTEHEARPDVLVFTADPLAVPAILAGEVAVEMHFEHDTPSSDLFVRICDVQPTGESINITDAVTRVSDPTPDRVEFALLPVAHVFGTGHRIRVQVCAGAHPRFARNAGGTEPLGKASTLHVQNLAIHHDGSAVVLPLAAELAPGTTA